MPEKTAAAKEAPRTVAALESSFRIQIASLKSEEAAKSAWSRLSKQNGDLFGKLQHQIVRIDLAGKGTFYRLQAGPLADASQAQALCSRVKQRKIGCLVVRP
jgi:cell division septation protein DedD